MLSIIVSQPIKHLQIAGSVEKVEKTSASADSTWLHRVRHASTVFASPEIAVNVRPSHSPATVDTPQLGATDGVVGGSVGGEVDGVIGVVGGSVGGDIDGVIGDGAGVSAVGSVDMGVDMGVGEGDGDGGGATVGLFDDCELVELKAGVESGGMPGAAEKASNPKVNKFVLLRFNNQ